MIDLIKEHIKIEKEHVRRLGLLQKKMDTAAGHLLIMEMSLDSQKHANLLEEILKGLDEKATKTPLWKRRIEQYTDRLTVKKELEHHMAMEDEVLRHVQKEIKQSSDEALKLLLQHIADDEKKHHNILQSIVKQAYKL